MHANAPWRSRSRPDHSSAPESAAADNAPRRQRQRSRPKNQRDRGGVAAVEFALIAPVFVMIILSMIEFGRVIMVQQLLTNASREGARRAVIEGASNTEVQTLVDSYLSNASVSGVTVGVAPSDLSNVGFGDAVVVSVSVPFDSVSWSGVGWFLSGSTLQASTTMQGERLQ